MGHGLDTNRQTNRAADRCRSLFASTRKEEQVGGAAGRTRTILETARASSKPCNGKLWRRKESKNRERSSEIGSAALRPLYARSFLRPRPPPFIAHEEAVWYSIPHQPNPTALILACTYFVLICLLARACVKNRFPRLGALIPLLDGFLHDIV